MPPVARCEEAGGGWELAYRGTDLMEVQLPGAAAGGEAGLVTRCANRRRSAAVTKIVQGWPKLWANFMALVGIFTQSIGPSLAIWANPVQFSFDHPVELAVAPAARC